MDKDGWDKLDIISKIVIAVALSWYGYHVNDKLNQQNSAFKERELKSQQVIAEQQKHQKELEHSQKYIEIAVNILNTEPKSNNDPLREWAIKILEQNSPVPLSPADIKSLRSKPIFKNAAVNLPSLGTTAGVGNLTATVNKPKKDSGVHNADVTLTGQGSNAGGALK